MFLAAIMLTNPPINRSVQSLLLRRFLSRNVCVILVEKQSAILKYARKLLAYMNNIKVQIWPVKVFTLLVLSEPCRFFQHLYHFHPCSDYLAEGPSMGKNFGSAQLKFGTDRLFTLQILSEPNPFFWDPCHFHPSRTKNFLSCKPGFSHHQLLCRLSWKSVKQHSTMHNLTFVFKLVQTLAQMLVSSSLNFKEHVTWLNNKISSQLGLLSRIRNNLMVYAAERVFIQP